jgi:hypothetical protein
MKYNSHYRGYMIFKKSNNCFCSSVNEDLNCLSVKDVWGHIDTFLRKQQMGKVAIPSSLRCILLHAPILN